MTQPDQLCWQCGSLLSADRPVSGSFCSTRCKVRWYRAKRTPEVWAEYRARDRERRRLHRIIPDLPDEKWRTVAGYEGWYTVSNMGRLKSVSRINGRGHYRPDRLVSGVKDKKGYVAVTLYKMDARQPCPDASLQVRHLNGNPSDNQAINLAWGTALENAADTKLHGRQWNLKKTHCKYNHEFTPENTYVNAKGQRSCKECGRRSAREWQRKKRAS